MSGLEGLLNRYGEERTLAPGEILFTQGSPGDGVYLLSIISPGEMVGELGTSTGRPRAATVMAAREACAVHISNEDFHRALRESPALSAEVINTVRVRLTEADVMRIALGHSYRQAIGRVESLRTQTARL